MADFIDLNNHADDKITYHKLIIKNITIQLLDWCVVVE